MKKNCSNGHTFYKTSDCPTCPTCAALEKPTGGFLSKLSAPARRALEHIEVRKEEQLSHYTEQEILALHGMGPASLPILRQALAEKGLSFKTKKT